MNQSEVVRSRFTCGPVRATVGGYMSRKWCTHEHAHVALASKIKSHGQFVMEISTYIRTTVSSGGHTVVTR